MIKVLVADDFPIIREGLRQAIDDTGDIKVAGACGTGQEVIALIAEKKFDVILLDISMPGRGGIEVLKQIRTIQPQLPVLILSMHPEEQYAVRAIKAGASGYVNKSRNIDELIAAIRKVASGRKYVSEELAENLVYVLDQGPHEDLHKTLSDREFEVLRKLASGITVSQIAEQMSLSVKTISTYRSRILQKMNMKNNAELTRYAIKNKIVD